MEKMAKVKLARVSIPVLWNDCDLVFTVIVCTTRGVLLSDFLEHFQLFLLFSPDIFSSRLSVVDWSGRGEVFWIDQIVYHGA